MNKTFRNLMQESSNPRRDREIIYFLSKKVKNINDYWTFKDQFVDFKIKKFYDVISKSSEKNMIVERACRKIFFYKNEFNLFKNVFCPRNETEILVEKIGKKIRKNQEFQDCSYIDICTGCGAIGISVFLENKKYLKKLELLDISKIAVKNVFSNLKKLNVDAHVINSDWEKYILKKKFQIISANFPYISEDDYFEKEILSYDPKKALFAKNDGWENYEKILNFAKKNKFWKLICCECSQFHHEKWKKIAEDKKYSELKFEFLTDLQNLFRFVFILQN